MTRRELNLAILEGTANAVLWQPRLEHWIKHRRERGTLPDRFCEMDNLQIYDELGCSCRYEAHAGLNYSSNLTAEYEERKEGPYTYYITRTEVGELTTVYQNVWENGKLTNSRIHEYPVKTDKDLRVLIHLAKHEQLQINPVAFQEADARVGQREEPSVIFNSAGFTELIKNWAGLIHAFYLLADYPELVEEYVEVCDNRDFRMLEQLFELPVKIINLGDHATNEFTPPPILKKYMLPRWQKISARISAEKRFVHSHWDGHSKTILPYLKDTGMHAIEALTPEPMGDMTLEEIKAAVGDEMVVLDLVPAILFLEQYSMQTVLDYTKRVIDMFAPRLILGVSDELPPGGQIEKIEAISELVRERYGSAD